MDIQEFLEMFNNGELDVEKYFKSYENWFNLLKKRGLIGEIDPYNASDQDSWQNEYLIWIFEHDREKYYEWVEKFLDDIEIDKETGKIYWVGDREDLASLFCDGNRYEVSQETVRKILSDDGDWFDTYWDTTDDVYRDVIEELNEKNIERLKEYILNALKDKQLSPETEEMELIAREQGHDEYWEIKPDNVTRIIDDKESMDSLLGDELSDLKSDLYSVHSNSYNSAYEEEIYEDIWKELGEYFVGPGDWISKPHPFKENTMIQQYKVETKDFEEIINNYLWNNKGYSYTGTLEYWGSYVRMIEEDFDCLTVRISDYPDFRKVDRNINNYFSDYI